MATEKGQYLHQIESRIKAFDPITLTEMDGVKLMNRTDTKFLLPLSHLPSLLDYLYGSYRLLEVNGHRLCTYETLYFDTPDLRFYNDHQRGRMNRYKIRQRHYLQSNLLFTEVKLKNNKGRTIKERIRCQIPATMEILDGGESQLDDESRQFVGQRIPTSSDVLRPVLWVGYKRLTFVSEASAERLTLDVNLSYRTKTGESDYSQVVIAELKQDTRRASAFTSLMKQKRIRQGGLSKYCLGMVSLYYPIKHNRFKQKLLHLQKFLSTHDYTATSTYS